MTHYQDMSLEKPKLFQRIIHSIFPAVLKEKNDRSNYRYFFRTLILHFRPRQVPEATLRFTLSWGLGGMAVVLLFILFATGLLLKFTYSPFPSRAYESIFYLQNEVLFGQLILNIHYWSANILLIIVFLHFLRVFFSSAFHPPRQFNWIIGLGLFLTVLLSNFTGYLLPWDQLSFWAITICTGMLEYLPGIGSWLQTLLRSGTDVGLGTLSNFYAIHTAILPVVIIVLIAFHFWRVRKSGGLVILRKNREDFEIRGEMVPSIPYLFLRETVVALVVIAFILLVSVFFDAPLEGKANPGLSPNPTKAPWYFMGFQEILLHFHPIIALMVIPVLMIIAFFSIPYINYPLRSSSVWFVSSKGRIMTIISVVVSLMVTVCWIAFDKYLFEFADRILGMSPVITNGLFPLIIAFIGIGVFYLLMKRRYVPDVNETIQMFFVFFMTSFIVLTITGIWFRGPGMKLIWPCLIWG
jgi:quinol-cytochrome oxidoreductase complex cytochrome b subunit